MASIINDCGAAKDDVYVHDIDFIAINTAYAEAMDFGSGNGNGVIERTRQRTALHDFGLDAQGEWYIRDNVFQANPTTGVGVRLHTAFGGQKAYLYDNVVLDGDDGYVIDNGNVFFANNRSADAVTRHLLALDTNGAYRDSQTVDWFFEGTVATGIHPFRWFPGRNTLLMYHFMGITVAPTGANLTMELLINGSSSQTTDFFIPAGSDSGTRRNIGNFNGNAMQEVSVGDYVEMSVLQVGSTEPGQDLHVEMEHLPFF